MAWCVLPQHHKRKRDDFMRDYFVELKELIRQRNYRLDLKEEISSSPQRPDSLMGFPLSEAAALLYAKYQRFDAGWFDAEDKYIGSIGFVPYDRLEQAHSDLVLNLYSCFDADADELHIRADLEHWYPLFMFPNGDAFCLDIRTGYIVFFDHEVFDYGDSLHGLRIAMDINDLLEKWSRCDFADAYDWSRYVTHEGIDPSKIQEKYKGDEIS